MSPFSALSSKTVFLKMQHTNMSKEIILRQFGAAHNSTGSDTRDEHGIASSQ